MRYPPYPTHPVRWTWHPTPVGPVPSSDDVRRPRALMAGRRVYLSGPMRGYPQNNFPAFDRTAAWLRRTLGIDVINPADLDREFFGVDGTTEVDKRTLNAMLQRDLIEVGKSDAVVLMPGWRASIGANMERDRAILGDIPRWELVGGRFLVPDRGFEGRARCSRLDCRREEWVRT